MIHDSASAPVINESRREEAASAARLLEGATPEQVLTWTVNTFGKKVTLATAFGPESCVMIDMLARSGLRLDLFTLDTSLFFPQTYELWKALEKRFGVTIRAVRTPISLEEQAREYGDKLWERDPDKCCSLRRVQPLREMLVGFDAWVAGLRRSHGPTRANANVVEFDSSHNILKVNPLVAWTDEQVWRYVRDHDLPTNPLHKEGYSSIGCSPCTSPVAPGEPSRAGRWRGFAKTECGIHVSPVTGRLVRNAGPDK